MYDTGGGMPSAEGWGYSLGEEQPSRQVSDDDVPLVGLTRAPPCATVDLL